MKRLLNQWKKIFSAVGLRVQGPSEKQRRRAAQSYRPQLEPLEPRQLLTTTVIDDGDLSFSVSGDFAPQSNAQVSAAYGGDNHNMRGGGEEAKATWNFENVADGEYQVAATWAHKYENKYNTLDAPFSIADVGGNLLASTTVNQSIAPNDFEYGGSNWDSLGTVNVIGGSLIVTLGAGSSSNTYTVADAIRIERVGEIAPTLTVSMNDAQVSEATGAAATTATVTRTDTNGDLVVSLTSDDTTEATVPATVTILDGQSTATFDIAAVDDATADGVQTVTISATATGYAGGSDTLDVTDDEADLVTILDDGESGFTQSGFTEQTNAQVSAAYDGDNHNMQGGSGTASWTFSGLDDGEYQVDATWAHKYENKYNTIDARFSIANGGGTLLASTMVDQSSAPNDFEYEGSNWDTLDTVSVTGGSLVVTLDAGSNSNTYTVADAVRIERIGDLPSNEINLHASPQILGEQTINLNAMFSATAGTLTYSIADNSNPDILEAAVINNDRGTLTLSPLWSGVGSQGDITIRATPNQAGRLQQTAEGDGGSEQTFTVTVNDNLIQNGSFENPQVSEDPQAVSAIPGWELETSDGALLKIEQGSAADGNQFLQLDAYPETDHPYSASDNGLCISATIRRTVLINSWDTTYTLQPLISKGEVTTGGSISPNFEGEYLIAAFLPPGTLTSGPTLAFVVATENGLGIIQVAQGRNAEGEPGLATEYQFIIDPRSSDEYAHGYMEVRDLAYWNPNVTFYKRALPGKVITNTEYLYKDQFEDGLLPYEDWDVSVSQVLPSADPLNYAVSQVAGTVAEQEYELTFAYSSDSEDDSLLNLQITDAGNSNPAPLSYTLRDATGNPVSGDVQLSAGSGWKKYSATFTAASSQTKIRFADKGVFNGKGTFVDDVRLVAVADMEDCGCSGKMDDENLNQGAAGASAAGGNDGDGAAGRGIAPSSTTPAEPLFVGRGNTVAQLARLMQTNSNTIIATGGSASLAGSSNGFASEYSQTTSADGSSAVYYDGDGTSFTARFAATDTLQFADGQYTETDRAGNVRVYYGFDSALPRLQRGALKSYTDSFGNRTEVTAFTTDGATKQVERSFTRNGVTTTETHLYAYGDTETDRGMVTGVTMQRNIDDDDPVTVRKSSYSYYAADELSGNLGDPKLAVIRDGEGELLDATYFRYYKFGEEGGYGHAVKYRFGPDSYARLAEAIVDPGSSLPVQDQIDAATDEAVAPYADNYYEYDALRRVTRVVSQATGCSGCDGGLGSVSYAFSQSAHSDAMNHWKTKTTETLPGGDQNISYLNHAGKEILSVFREASSSGNEWLNYTRYDAEGRAVLRAGPDAVTGYDEAKPDLLDDSDGDGDFAYLADDAGKITTTTYYDATTATTEVGGSVDGYFESRSLQQGELGTSLLQNFVTYVAAPGGAEVYYTESSTAYLVGDGSEPLTTSHSYTFHSGTAAIESQSTTRPVVTDLQNGSDTAATSTRVYDLSGRVIWSRDADGFLSYTAYDVMTGAVTRQIVDVDVDDDTRTGDFADLPGGWITPGGGGAHLMTEMDIDAQGRTTRVTGPTGNTTYTVYLDASREVRTYGGWDAASGTSLLPTQISRHDRAGNYYESLSISTAPAVDAEGLPTGGELIVSSGIESLGRQRMNSAGQVTERDSYFSLAGVDYSPDPNNSPDRELGTEGTHFLRSDTYYDFRGRVARSEDATGTIVRTVFDGLDRAIGTWTGTNDTPSTGHWSPTNAAHMLQTAATEYDDGGVGPGYVTGQEAIFGEDEADRIASEFEYDFRGRRTGSRSADGVAVDALFDNLGRVTEQSSYADLDGDFELDPEELRAHSQTTYDAAGQVFETLTYEVDPSDGTLGDSLTSRNWYDLRGNLIKSATPSGLLSKTSYDGVGRAVRQSMSIDAAETSWDDAHDLAGDTVIEQSETRFDAGGRPVVNLSFARLEDDTNSTGPLDGAGSYRSASVSWYDAADRPTHTASFGRDNGPTSYVFDATGGLIDTDGDGIPDEAEGAPREPNQSADWIASKTEYDAAGRAYRTIDNLGRITQTDVDLLGRTTATISNYVDGWDSADTDTDQTVEYVYDSAGRLSELVAKNGTEDQTTRYLYESPHNGSWQTAVIYPDSSDFDSSGTDQVQTTFDRLGRTLTTTDQRGVEHSFSFDTAGRLSADEVTHLPAGVDGTISRIERSYDDVSRVSSITSYGNNELGEFVANQVEHSYNGYGLVSETWQSHEGAVDGSTPSVKYNYDDGASAGEARYVRLSSVEYPNGLSIYYLYAESGIGDALSRVEAIAGDPSGMFPHAEYAYLGAGTIVSVAHPAVSGGLTLDYNPSGNTSGDADPNPNDNYEGWDRFGRVVDQRWTDGAGATDLDRYTYTYDGNSNRTSRSNELNGAFSETYSYDGLSRLVDTNRNGTDLQSWNLDSLGNWSSFTDEGTTETRTHNAANEIQNISSTAVPPEDAVSPEFDAAGNMISGPRPDDPLVRQHYIYDAWNRLVEVRADNPDNSGDAIATFEYDGRNYRIGKTVGGVLEAFYYNEGSQVLEVRKDGDIDPSEQYVWDLRYIDAPILRATPGEVLYYANDANFNVTALIDAATGNVVERYHYDPYGEVLFMEADWTPRAASDFDNAVLYTGRRLDTETGLFYYRARYYDVALGRFINRDPIGYGDGPNVYQYVGGKTTNAADPAGTKQRTLTIPVLPLLLVSAELVVEYDCSVPEIDVVSDKLVGGPTGGGIILVASISHKVIMQKPVTSPCCEASRPDGAEIPGTQYKVSGAIRVWKTVSAGLGIGSVSLGVDLWTWHSYDVQFTLQCPCEAT